MQSDYRWSGEAQDDCRGSVPRRRSVPDHRRLTAGEVLAVCVLVIVVVMLIGGWLAWAVSPAWTVTR